MPRSALGPRPTGPSTASAAAKCSAFPNTPPAQRSERSSPQPAIRNAADGLMLPDVLEPNLRVVFCGTAAGSASARAGAYYAGPGNSFWRTIHAIGLTPRQLRPQEFASCPLRHRSYGPVQGRGRLRSRGGYRWVRCDRPRLETRAVPPRHHRVQRQDVGSRRARDEGRLRAPASDAWRLSSRRPALHLWRGAWVLGRGVLAVPDAAHPVKISWAAEVLMASERPSQGTHRSGLVHSSARGVLRSGSGPAWRG